MAESTFSHDAVLQAENLLLTFTSIGKDIFPQATKTVLDMSTALGQDLKSSSIQLGKALQDPVMGVTALRRVGVNFTKSQQEMIGVLVKTGHSLEAQKIILAELANEFGGSALAQTKTFSGQMKMMKNDLDDVKEEIGKAVVPVLRSLVDSIRPVIDSVRKWMEAHPELVKQIGQLAMKAGLLMLVLGPLVYMIPKIVSGFGAIAGAGKSVVGAFGALNKPISTSGNLLGKLALVGAAAFVGWKIGKLIGEVTGLNGVLEGAFDKVFKLTGIIKEHNTEANLGAGHAAAFAKQQEYIALASEASGTKVKNLREAIDVMEGVYKKTGTTGNEAFDVLVKAHIKATEEAGKHKEAVKKSSDSLYDLAGKLKEAAETQKEYTDFLKDMEIPTQKERELAIKDSLLALDALSKSQKEGLVGEEKALEIKAKLNEKLWDYGYYVKTAIPPSRTMNDIWKNLPKVLDSNATSIETVGDLLGRLVKELNLTGSEARQFVYEIANMKLAMMSLAFGGQWKLPPLDWTDFDNKVKDGVKETSNAFSGLFNDIASAWGNTIQKFLEGGVTFKDFVKDLWKDVKDTFFRMIGEMIAKWTIDFLKNVILDATKSATTTAASSIASVGTGVSTLATTAGSVFATIGTIITTLASALATALGTIATGIATAIVALATGIATAATILAAAAVPLLIVGAIAIAIFAGFKAIESLFGGGGGKQTDVTYWLKMMHADGKEMHDFFLGDFREGYMNSIVSDIVYSKQKLEDINRGIWDSKDFLGPMLTALQSIDSNIQNLKGASSGAVSTATELLVVHGTPSAPEVTAPLPMIQEAVMNAQGARAGLNVYFQADFNINALDGANVRDVVREQIAPELVDWIRTNAGKALIGEALGV
jgi:hypothetical protein